MVGAIEDCKGTLEDWKTTKVLYQRPTLHDFNSPVLLGEAPRNPNPPGNHVNKKPPTHRPGQASRNDLADDLNGVREARL